MRRGVYVAAVVACAAVAAGALAGCQGDGSDPTPSPSESTSSSASTVGPSESTSPSPQAETAEEFIRRWVDVRNEMQNTGDTQEYRRLSKGCEPCIELAGTIDDYYEAGGFVETDGWQATKVSRQGAKGQTSVFHVTMRNAPTRYAEESGAETQTLPGGEPIMRITLRRRSNGYVVTDLAQVAT